MSKPEFLSDTEAQEKSEIYSLTSSKNSKIENDEEIEMVFIQESPMMMLTETERPRGSFLVFPMRTAYDKLWYGTGIAYFAGKNGTRLVVKKLMDLQD